MKTIGLIGGMSWESSATYYRLINEGVKARLGGFHSAKCMLVSVDFAEIEILQQQGRWQEAGELLVGAAQSLEKAGADFVVLCTNTMHKLADEIQAGIHIPFLHIADATAEKIKADGVQKIGLLGTRFTMEQDFYKGRLAQKHGLQVLTPQGADGEFVHRVIYDELVKGVVRPESKAGYLAVIERLAERGAEGVILGCTEIGMLVQAGDCQIPVYDTTLIHAQAAVQYALED